MVDVTIGLAFLAGLASFLSPCVFSLVPAYVGYLSGRSIAANQVDAAPSKMQSFLHGLAFVAGFSAIFLTLGLTMSAVTQSRSIRSMVVARSASLGAHG